MSRRLFAVALLPTGDALATVETLRTVIGDPRRADLPAHVTLVPPVNLPADQVALARATLRAAARTVAPFELCPGPAATFAPQTSTLHLSVEGDLEVLERLRDALRAEPWDRPDHHPFVPHLTLLQRATPEQVAAGTALLVGASSRWTVDSIHLLERIETTEGRIWHPVAEEPLGGPRRVGRGGVELDVRVISTVEPEMAEMAEAAEAAGSVGDRDASPLPAGGDLLVAVAEQPDSPGRVVGVAIGRSGSSGAVLERVVVDARRRREGVARRLVADWCDVARRRGAGVAATSIVSSPPAGEPDPAVVMAALGFSSIGGGVWCRRLGPSGALASPR